MATLHLIHGFVGAGKTTYAKKLQEESGALVYSPDEWMRERHGANPPATHFKGYLDLVYFDIETDAANRLRQGFDVIFDFGLWKRSDRDRYRAFAEALGVQSMLHHIFADPKIMKERVLKRTETLPEGQLVIDEAAIEEFRKHYEPLGKDEQYITIRTG